MINQRSKAHKTHFRERVLYLRSVENDIVSMKRNLFASYIFHFDPDQTLQLSSDGATLASNN